MAWAVVVGAAISGGVALYKGAKAHQQTVAANAMKPLNPGYRQNQGSLANAKTVSDYYGNYQLPGYSKMLNDVNSNYQNEFANGVQGATSSGDILDIAAKAAYGKNQALNQLGVQNAMGKEGALDRMINTNQIAGQEGVNQNAYDRDMFAQQEREKAALTQAGEQNMYGAIDQIGATGVKLAGRYLGSSKGGANGSDSPTDTGFFDRWYFPNGSPRYDQYGNPVAMKTFDSGVEQEYHG